MQSILIFIIISSVLLYFNALHPHFLLANAIPINTNPQSINKANETDFQALLAIKAEISSDPNSVLSSWNNSLHFCLWKGVTCGRRHQRVVSLHLFSSNLDGKLSPSIANLSFLHTLALSDNSFRGEIPHQISHLPRLQSLYLERNSFEGEIPSNLSNCLHLTLLNLSSNHLVGRIPSELSFLPKLEFLDLSSNNLSGEIGNMSSSLEVLNLGYNQLQGKIPNDIGRLKDLSYLNLRDNLLYGTILSSLFNLSSLTVLDLSNTKFHGHLPNDLGLRLPRLGHLYISNIFLTGQVPVSLSNLSELQTLDISHNSFTGSFSLNGNNLPRLFCLESQYAFSLGGETKDLSFFDTLTNCTNLQHLYLGGNSFTGILPPSLLNLSQSLLILSIEENQISGQLPFGLGKFVKLYILGLQDNHFTGSIPTDFGMLKSLQLFYLNNNNFSGEIPSSMGNLTQLSTLTMSRNNLEGSLPKNLGYCKSLQYLYLYSNKLSGALPVEFFRATSLLNLVIGQNNIQGSLPVEISMLKNLVLLDVSQNRFSGEIPSTLGGCTSLTTIDMSQNSFVGSIPESLSPLKSIQKLDLSCNNLSGQIPSYFPTWPFLSSLNLSFNYLEGEVPINRVFSNTSIVSIVGNNKLCGGVLELHLPKCTSHKILSLTMIMIIFTLGALIIVISVTLCFYKLCLPRKKKDSASGLQDIKPFLDMSYQMLSRATNGFSPSNLIGAGAFGSVYKGILHQVDIKMEVAVKVMKLQNKGASKSFIAECNALRNIRHRNLVKIITACSSIDTQLNDFKALVYEFIPRGSLESWLHSNILTSENGGDDQPYSLSLFQRLSIAIDVATAIEYLHIECANPVIHCDLKPSNILLDDEMTAHVGDFGLAKFLSGASISNIGNQSSSTQVRGTVGYAAPEYGLGSNVSTEGDIYSFGIIVLEMMTSKKPTNPMFSDGLNLHDFAKSALPNQVIEIIDQRMLDDSIMTPAKNDADIRKIECIKSLIMIGVHCSLEVPRERMNIKDVVNEMKSTMQNFLCGRT